MGNPNHPKKGDIITVDPIREPKDIKAIKRLLADKPRDFALFCVPVNTNLRASDTLKLKVGDVRGLQVGEHFTIREQKTGKERNVTMNKTVHEAIKNLLATMPKAENHEPLFQSRKGDKQALTVPYFSGLVKSWCREINLKGNYAAHSLRKSWGFQMRTVHHVDIPTLMTIYNHSSQAQTLAYLGIQPSEIKDAYLKEI